MGACQRNRTIRFIQNRRKTTEFWRGGCLAVRKTLRRQTGEGTGLRHSVTQRHVTPHSAQHLPQSENYEYQRDLDGRSGEI
jgi:hypothetical protein